MKILYFFPEQKTPMYQWQREHFFEELSRKDIFFDVLNPLDYKTPEEANETVIRQAASGAFDLFMTSLCNEKIIFPETLMYLQSKGIPSISLRCDNLTIPYNDKVLAKYFDLVWLFSPETIKMHKSWGANVFFAPFAANPYKYKFTPGQIIRKSCFIGTPYGSRPLMINTLSSNQIPVDLFYGGARRNNQPIENETIRKAMSQSGTVRMLNRVRYSEGRKLLYAGIVDKLKGQPTVERNEYVTINPSVPFEQMISTYSDYALSLAFTATGHTDVLKEPLHRTFLRTFEIPMCGGLQICKYNEELASYFEDGKEIILYKSDEEMIDKASYYINKASDAEIMKMKEAARYRSENEHTWTKRFEAVFKMLNIKL